MSKDKLVFIIEQERLIGLDLQLQLEQNGYTVFRPLSLVDTETIIRHDTPDLIIANASIQRQDNFSRIKKYFGRQQLPIIFISGQLSDNLTADKKLNIIGTFSKPFDSKEIVALVDNHFGQRTTTTKKTTLLPTAPCSKRGEE